VVEEVDLLDVLAAVAALELPAVDAEPQPVRVLRREHRELPERKEVRREQEESRDHQQSARPQLQREGQITIDTFEYVLHLTMRYPCISW
jgi:hypothetical protein